MDPKRTTPPSSTTLTRATSGGGVILGKYELGRLLGRGSFAKVYKARSLSDNTTVAIKVIDKSTTINAAMEARITSEISAMRRLAHHPNILNLHEVLATKSKIYLVMELAEGGELFAKLARRGRLSEPNARRYFQQLISALHFCHQNGFAHRDIKPQNLLLDKENNLKISDFGLSALPEQIKNGLLHTACGTPAYTAPEVLYRKGYDGSKADAWSCGVILFVFLAGSLPFDDSNLSNMYKKMHCRDFQFPDWISRPARSIIYRLLDPNPTTRMSVEVLMNHVWFKRSLSREIKLGCAFDWSSVNDKYMSRMNAFDIISMSSGLDLSRLFDGGFIKKERRFTSSAKVEKIEEKLEEVGGKLGYEMQRVKGGGIGFAKGRVVLMAEILELAKGLLLVQLKVVEGEREFGELQWEELTAGFGDFVLSWYDAA